MNKKLALIFVCTMIYGVSFAQDTPGQSIIKTNPIGLAFGNINLTFERALNNSSSFQVGANFFTKILGTDVSGIGFNAGYRFYITNAKKPAPEGFYVGPRFAYNSFKEKSTDISASTIGIGAMLGYQWVFDSGVTLDLGAGPTYLIAGESTTTVSFEGLVPNISFAVGYNF